MGRSLGEMAFEPLDSTLQAVPASEFDELFDYPRKTRRAAWLLWLATGLVGGHRLYLGRIGTAVAMLFTGGGAMIWWVVDAFLIGRMVEGFNAEQERRERGGLPPVELDAMGPVDRTSLLAPPSWAPSGEGRRFRGLLGDAAVLLFAGSALGTVSRSTGDYKGLAVVAAMVFMLNLPAGLYRWRELPLVGGLVRWDLRLHAYYHNHDPGSVLARLARPITGWITSVFRPKNWTETRLYLQLGVAASMLFGLVDLGRDVAAPYLMSGVTVNPIEAWVEGTTVTLVVVFFFTVPVGATLVKYSLLDRPRIEGWALSAMTAAAVVLGLLAPA